MTGFEPAVDGASRFDRCAARIVMHEAADSFPLSSEKEETFQSPSFSLVRVTGFEPAASWSQTTRATNCATPGRFQFSARNALLPTASAYTIRKPRLSRQRLVVQLRYTRWSSEETRSIPFPPSRRKLHIRSFLLPLPFKALVPGFERIKTEKKPSPFRFLSSRDSSLRSE